MLAILTQQFLLFQRTRLRQLSMNKLNKRARQSFQTKALCKKAQHAFSVRKSTQGMLSM